MLPLRRPAPPNAMASHGGYSWASVACGLPTGNRQSVGVAHVRVNSTPSRRAAATTARPSVWSRAHTSTSIRRSPMRRYSCAVNKLRKRTTSSGGWWVGVSTKRSTSPPRRKSSTREPNSSTRVPGGKNCLGRSRNVLPVVRGQSRQSVVSSAGLKAISNLGRLDMIVSIRLHQGQCGEALDDFCLGRWARKPLQQVLQDHAGGDHHLCAAQCVLEQENRRCYRNTATQCQSPNTGVDQECHQRAPSDL